LSDNKSPVKEEKTEFVVAGSRKEGATGSKAG
jgi:hypothetical protein